MLELGPIISIQLPIRHMQLVTRKMLLSQLERNNIPTKIKRKVATRTCVGVLYQHARMTEREDYTNVR
jgi:hypothetical protein